MHSLEDNNVAKHPTMVRGAPHKRTIQPRLSAVPRLINLGLNTNLLFCLINMKCLESSSLFIYSIALFFFLDLLLPSFFPCSLALLCIETFTAFLWAQSYKIHKSLMSHLESMPIKKESVVFTRPEVHKTNYAKGNIPVITLQIVRLQESWLTVNTTSQLRRTGKKQMLVFPSRSQVGALGLFYCFASMIRFPWQPDFEFRFLKIKLLLILQDTDGSTLWTLV